MTWYNYLSVAHHIIALILSIIVFCKIQKYKGTFFTFFKIINIIFIAIHIKYAPAVVRWADAPTPQNKVEQHVYNPKEVYDVLKSHSITDLRFIYEYELYKDEIIVRQNLTDAVGFEYDLPFIWTENETALASILFSVVILLYHSIGYTLVVLYRELKEKGFSDFEIKNGTMFHK